MKKSLPVDELARDERFIQVDIQTRIEDPRVARPSRDEGARLTPKRADAPDAARALMHGIFVGEIQALEGAGRTCWDFEVGSGRGRDALRAQARHGPPVLGRGPSL